MYVNNEIFVLVVADYLANAWLVSVAMECLISQLMFVAIGCQLVSVAMDSHCWG